MVKSIGKKYALPTKKNVMSDGKVQMGYSQERKDLSFNEIADRYIASLSISDSRRRLAQANPDRVADERPGR